MSESDRTGSKIELEGEIEMAKAISYVYILRIFGTPVQFTSEYMRTTNTWRLGRYFSKANYFSGGIT